MSTIGGGVNIVTDGLVLYLDAANTKSYPESGTAWSDLSRNGSNGTIISSSGYTSSNGGAVTFSSSATGSVSGTTTLASSFSVGASFMPLTLVHYSPAFSLGANGGSGGWGDFVFHTTNSGEIYCGTDVGNRFNPTNNGCGSGAFVINRNYDVLFTYASGVGRIYKNGILLASKSMNAPINLSTTAPYKVFNTNGLTSSMRVYAFRVYNRALSAQEILQNYNATKNRFGL